MQANNLLGAVHAIRGQRQLAIVQQHADEPRPLERIMAAAVEPSDVSEMRGIDDPQGLKFFIVHHSLDVEHSKVTRNLVAKYGDTPEAEKDATNAVDEATTALNTFLDGVCREYVAA